MLRKLASLLFKEEEIVVEEEEHEVESVRIPRVEPVKAASVEKRQVELDPIDEELLREQRQTREFRSMPNPSVTEPKGDMNTTHAKKSFRIDLDEQAYHKNSDSQVKREPVIQQIEPQKPYTSKEIISPIHGGPAAQNEPLKKAPQPQNVKKRKPLTEVISPMYGKVVEEKKETEAVDLSVLDLDVKAMITPDYEENNTTDGVQTSLFDYLEGDDSRES